MVSGDNMSNFSENNDDEYAMVFTLSRKPNQQTELSNIIAETYLKSDHILLMKKSLIKRSKISNEIIPFKEIVEINLNRSDGSTPRFWKNLKHLRKIRIFMKKRVGLQEMIFMLQEMILIWIKLMNWKIL